MSFNMIDLWKIRRKQKGQPCEVMPFHHLIAEKVTDLVLGRLSKPDLMILMPPRCGKTDLGGEGTIEFSHSWFPDSESIVASYGQDLAVQTVMNTRDTFSSNWYRSAVGSDWGVTVPMLGSKAGGRQDHYRTTRGGSVKGIGRGGGITGFGAGKLRREYGGVVLMDDLLKAQESRSPAARKDAWNYINATLNSRRNRQDTPSTPRILIMQRLHPEDPAGMLLREERENWEVLEIPAHDGHTVIWPGRLSMQKLMDMAEVDPETYWAQYMQKPQQDTLRKILKDTWWRYWRNRQEVERRITYKIITADTAFEDKKSADWSVFQCWGFEGTSAAYLLDQDRGQWDFPDLMQHARAFKEKHVDHCPATYTPASKFYIENKASGISLIQTLRKQEGIHATPWEPKNQTAPDKVGRARQMALPLHAGRIYIPDPELPEHKWVKTHYLPECGAFSDDDSHLNDDQVDSSTEAICIWIEMGGATGPIPAYT